MPLERLTALVSVDTRAGLEVSSLLDPTSVSLSLDVESLLSSTASSAASLVDSFMVHQVIVDARM